MEEKPYWAYDLDTSITHITMETKMDYEIHRWACEQWGHPPTATAFALITSDTLREAKESMEGSIHHVHVWENEPPVAESFAEAQADQYEE